MFSSGEFSKWTGAEWKNSADEFSITGVSHDTRTLDSGAVYIALRGAVHDGHDFIPAAVERGAVALVVEKEIPSAAVPQLIVPDSLTALRKLAAGVRTTWNGTVIGITGSAGKTTVKEMIAAVLSQKGRVSKTPGNWNNEIGLPLSMLAAERDSDFFVFELGMNHAGEIAVLASLLQPDWAVITDIGKAHIEFFDSVEAIATEKASLLKFAKNALLDETSEWFELLKQNTAGKISMFSDEVFEFSISVPGEHMIRNARRAVALARGLGFSAAEIQRGLDAFVPADKRWERAEISGVVFINDAYNANPLSMRAALTTFAGLPVAGKKVAVVGAMRELGAASDAEHRELGALIDSLNFDCVITIGSAGAKIVCRSCAGLSKEAAAEMLAGILNPGDAVFFKASRGEQLETLVEGLKEKINSTGNHE
ncbi:MAG: Mur ligase family protein [Kiritimatiellales bacterium]